MTKRCGSFTILPTLKEKGSVLFDGLIAKKAAIDRRKNSNVIKAYPKFRAGPEKSKNECGSQGTHKSDGAQIPLKKQQLHQKRRISFQSYRPLKLEKVNEVSATTSSLQHLCGLDTSLKGRVHSS